jgi:hypothetical protein
MRRNVANCGLAVFFACSSAGIHVGMLPRSFVSSTCAWTFVARYLMSCQAAAGCGEPLGMPVMFPVVNPPQ